jgi:hypothetical protein
MMTHEDIACMKLASPRLCLVEFTDEDGEKLREPLHGQITLEEGVGEKILLVEHRTNVFAGAKKEHIVHFEDGVALSDPGEETVITLFGTWVDVSRRFIKDDSGSTGSYRFERDKTVERARAGVRLLL